MVQARQRRFVIDAVRSSVSSMTEDELRATVTTLESSYGKGEMGPLRSLLPRSPGDEGT